LSDQSSIVSLQNVGLRYGKGREVLRDINLELQPASFQFLTGPSGAGKTSLLRLLFLSRKPTRGLITMFGKDMATLPRRRLPKVRQRIGVVFQDFRLLDHLTTFENIALPLRVAGKSVKEYRENVHELLEWVGLADYADAYPPVMSGGEKQRVAIARAVITQPDLLLADEPTGNVDPAMAVRLLRLFAELNRFGTTIVIATHDTTLIARSKTPVLELIEGRLGYRQ
jgi:cell division transport system ATP-binding protein